jgi:hypothetical protein
VEVAARFFPRHHNEIRQTSWQRCIRTIHDYSSGTQRPSAIVATRVVPTAVSIEATMGQAAANTAIISSAA